MPIKPKEFDNLNGFLSLGSQIERKIDKLRSKITEEVVDESSYDHQMNVCNEEISENHQALEIGLTDNG